MLILSLLLIVLFTIHKNSKENILINQLYNKVYNGEKVNTLLFDEYSEIKEQKINSGRKLNAEQYFFIAYKYYCEGNMENTQKYCFLALQNINDRTDPFIKIYIGFLLDSSISNSDQDEKLLNIASEIFKDLKAKDWNEHYFLIYSYMAHLFERDKAEEYLINIYENILQNKKGISNDCKIYMDDLFYVLYIEQGNYAKALEITLEMKSLADSNEFNKSDLFISKAFLNLGEVNYYLGDYAASATYLKKCLEVQVKNDEGNAIKISALDYLMSISQADYDIDKVKEFLDIAAKYADDKNNETSKLIYYISLSDYYAKCFELEKNNDTLSNLNKAEKYLDIVKKGIDEKKNTTCPNLDIIYENTVARLEYVKGNIDQAIMKYEELVNKYNNVYVNQVLKELINIYEEKGEYQKAYVYSERLRNQYTNEAVLINKNYAEYSAQKYEYEINIIKMNNKKIKAYFTSFIFILISVTITVFAYMKNKSLKQLNRTDSLTKIYNRSYFNNLYEKILNNENNFAIFIFDIDNFKSINDTYGHLTGDMVLIKVAQTAKEVLNKKGKIFRYGGEEFVIIIEEINFEEASKIAQNIVQSIDQLTWDNENMHVTISMGAAFKKDTIGNPLEKADERLYVSKTSGKNRVTWN